MKRILIVLINLIIMNSIYAQNKIGIIYPKNLPCERGNLTKFYDSFIPVIIANPEIQEISIIHRAGLKENLIKSFPSPKIKLIEINTVQDIWLRDFAPFYIKDSVAYKGIYNPSYFLETKKKTKFLDKDETIFYYASFDDEVGFLFANQTNLKIKEVDLTIDGGNFVHNGAGIGITTNRIISENENLSIEEINNLFDTELGISKLIILPVEPGDETGHIDGMVRFINTNTVVVGSYENDYIEGHDFMNKIANNLSKEFNVVRVVNISPQKQSQEEFVSAYGNYINYLQVGNTIYLPQYGMIEKDYAAQEVFEKYFNVILVKEGINELSKLGGVLNCITWNY